jgi:hypothetical protein
MAGNGVGVGDAPLKKQFYGSGVSKVTGMIAQLRHQ